MTPHDAVRQEVADALHERVLPWLRQGMAHLVLGEPPLQPPSAVKVVPVDIPLLHTTKRKRQHFMLASWERAGLVSIRYPRFLFVLDGEADYSIGVTESMAAKNSAIRRSHGRYILQLPQRSIVLIQAGVPYSDGSIPHWERPHLELARSRLLWMTAIGGGAELHLCTTRGAEHAPSVSTFVRDARITPLVELLLESLAEDGPTANETALSTMLVLMLRIARGCRADETSVSATVQTGLLPDITHTRAIHDSAVHRACAYIDANFVGDLSTKEIAEKAYVSVSHLNRLFRAELNTTVAAYVTSKRIELAKFLLQTTELPIRDISIATGYRHPNYLSYVFAQATGMSPLEFRRQALNSQLQK